MQSSSTLTLRALVMLVCLIAVPLLAVTGTSLPKLVTEAIKGRKPLRSPTAPEHVAQVDAHRGGEAPPFSPTVQLPERGVAAADRRVPPPVAAPRTAAAKRTQETPPATPGAGISSAPLWGPGVPPTATTPARSQPTNFESTADRAPTGPGAASHHGGPPAGTAPPRYAQSGTTMGPSAQADNPERFTQIQRRLRDLGATYYLLETWGDNGEQFRFHCKMPVAGNPNYTRPFEATHRDPLAAMQKVLEQVEAWRGGRQP